VNIVALKQLIYCDGKENDMEAICKPDYDKREEAHNDAEKTKKMAEKEGKSTRGIIVPNLVFTIFTVSGILDG
jgi:hypothetical protein